MARTRRQMMNPLQAIPAKIRQSIYLAYGLVVLAEGGASAGYSTVGAGLPSWLVVTLAVTAYVGGALGFTAAANVARVAPTDPNSGLADQISVISEQLATLDAKVPELSPTVVADPASVEPVPVPILDPVPASDPVLGLNSVPADSEPGVTLDSPSRAARRRPASVPDVPTAIADLTRKYVEDGTAILNQVLPPSPAV